MRHELLMCKVQTPGGHTRPLISQLRTYGADVVLRVYQYHLAKPKAHSTAVTICTTGSEAEGTRHVTPQCIYVLRVILTINSDYLPKQH